MTLAPPLSPLALVVLISGGGTTLRNLIEKIAAERLDAEIRLVISSNARAVGLEFAQRAGIPTAVVRRGDYESDSTFSTEIFSRCRDVEPHLVVLGGFLKLLEIPPDFEHRVMNIHPALVPRFCGRGFYGHRVHQAVLAAGVKVSGCTVHFVDNEYDHGPIILQKTVPVEEGDTPEQLAERVFAAECEAYPEALELFAQHRLRVEGNRVVVVPASPAQ